MQQQSDDKYFRKIEYVFYNEAEIRELVQEEKLRIIRHEISGGSLSDPTAAQVLKDSTPVNVILIGKALLRYPEHWLEVVDLTKQWCEDCGDDFYQIMKRRYGLREEIKKTCANLSISADFYYKVVDKIKMHAALLAAYLHLISF